MRQAHPEACRRLAARHARHMSYYDAHARRAALALRSAPDPAFTLLAATEWHGEATTHAAQCAIYALRWLLSSEAAHG